jgi:hypothetical protein
MPTCRSGALGRAPDVGAVPVLLCSRRRSGRRRLEPPSADCAGFSNQTLEKCGKGGRRQTNRRQVDLALPYEEGPLAGTGGADTSVFGCFGHPVHDWGRLDGRLPSSRLGGRSVIALDRSRQTGRAVSVSCGRRWAAVMLCSGREALDDMASSSLSNVLLCCSWHLSLSFFLSFTRNKRRHLCHFVIARHLGRSFDTC